MMGLSYFVPLTTRPCKCEVYASSDCSSLYHRADSVAPRATKRCQVPWLNWVATLFSKIRHPSYGAVFSTQGGTGYLVLKIQGRGGLVSSAMTNPPLPLPLGVASPIGDRGD
jgi:hypothetical protein